MFRFHKNREFLDQLNISFWKETSVGAVKYVESHRCPYMLQNTV